MVAVARTGLRTLGQDSNPSEEKPVSKNRLFEEALFLRHEDIWRELIQPGRARQQRPAGLVERFP